VLPPDSGWRALRRPAVLLGGGAVAAIGVVSVLSGRGVGWLAGLVRSGDTVTWTSPSTAFGLVVNSLVSTFGGHVDAVPVTRALGLVVLAGVLIRLWWSARHADPLVAAGLALVATVLCAPVFHPWYATWPLVVLAAVGPPGWLLIGCGLAATLTLPAGFNWALGTRVPGSWLVTVALAAYGVRRLWTTRRAVTRRG
jgi:hypothetical protein